MFHLALDDLVARALTEDLGDTGDLTSTLTVPADARGLAALTVRQEAVLSGTEVVDAVCRAVDPELVVEWAAQDGDRVQPGQQVGILRGRSRSVLTAERTALNFLGRLSAVATATAHMVDLVDGTGVSIVDTRKTTPGLRALEKAAVRHGGGVNHRFGLYDAVLVKDNHLGLGGGLRPVLNRLAEGTGHLVRVEIEVDTLDQLRELLAYDAARIEGGHSPVVHTVMLDNMGPDQVREGVGLVSQHPAPVLVEVSGGVTADSVRALAEAGPDIISVGALTHSAGCVDFGLDLSEDFARHSAE